MKTKEKARKMVAGAAAFAAAAAVIFGGTFAWQSITQDVQNEENGYANPGARLHDDFNGLNKDIYVENFTDPDDNGIPVYARIRLKEYMETGKGAGNPGAADRDVTVIGKTDADINDKLTWLVHVPGDLTQEDTQIHKYWKWEMGGKTVYMPTFNKDHSSLEADVNGTFAGPDGIKLVNPATGLDDKFEDYKEYTLDETKTGNAAYAGGISAEETHQAKETDTAQVLTMDDWKAMGSPVGKYWVYDTDGWAYWADSIQPGEATGLFLSGITSVKTPDEEWYYSINVEGQFATAGDWGDKDLGSGFYEDGITDDGLFVLNQAAGRLPNVVTIKPKNGYKQYVKAGESLNLEVDIDIEYPSGKPSETYVTWRSEPDTTCLNGNQFTPTDNMVGQTYKLTATSAYDSNATTFVDVYVYPREAVGVVNGEMDGKIYVDFGDNTFKEINADGSLGEFVSGGVDETIGNGDDRFNVVVIDPMDPTFGSKFIGPDGYGYYYAMGPDGKLGTGDDIKVVGDPWPSNISSTLADAVTVTSDGDQTEIKVGRRLQMNAVVSLKGKPIPNQRVTWRVAGNNDPNTSMDTNGVLTVGSNETVGTVLNVYAESVEQKGLESFATITVVNFGYEDLPSLPVGTTTTVTIDGIDWYVLAKDGNKALLWSKNTVGENQMFAPSTNRWQNSTIRPYLNNDLLNTLSFLKDKVVETEITTRTQYTASTWDTTIDKVFLLTEADLFGTHNNNATSDARDYTYNGKVLVPDINMRKFTGTKPYAFLRSPRLNNLGVAGCPVAGTAPTGYNSVNVTQCVRPAMWVEMP